MPAPIHPAGIDPARRYDARTEHFRALQQSPRHQPPLDGGGGIGAGAILDGTAGLL
jgi:hypothetical protein